MGISDVLALLGGVALFLFGMSLMGDNLKKVAGKKLEVILYKLSGTPLKGLFLGAGVTAVIQSSSATSVMVVGFVNSGMMKVRQAIGVIMGSIIGTSITGWIICLSDIGSGTAGFLSLLSTENLSAMVALIGILLIMVSKKKLNKNIGGILMGFSVLMYGMKFMSNAVSGLRDVPEFIAFLTDFSSPILGILFGAAFTAILQSASAAVGIVQALAVTGAISFNIALPVIIGISIGASFPVLLSSIGASTDAKRSALSYLVVTGIGMIPFVIVFYTLNAVIGFDFMSTIMNSFSIALLNTLYRVLIMVVLAPFIKVFEKIVCTLIKSSPEDSADLADFERLEERFLAHPALAIEQSGLTIKAMARKSRENLLEAIGLIENYNPSVFDKVNVDEKTVDKYEDKLGTYLVKVTGTSLDEAQSSEVSKYLHTINDFERMSDHALNIAESARERKEKGILFTTEGWHEIKLLRNAVTEIVDLSITAFIENDLDLASKIEPLEDVIDDLCDQLKMHHIERVQKGECTLQIGYVFNDMLTDFERVADHCSNIGVAMLELSRGTMEVHEHFEALQADKMEIYRKEYESFSAKYSLENL